MTILKLVQTDMGEIVYLFDGEQVVKTWVKDLTQPKRVRVTEAVEEYQEEVIAPRKRQQRPVEIDNEEIVYNRDLPPVAKKSIIPPGIASMMKPQGTPGEHVTQI